MKSSNMKRFSNKKILIMKKGIIRKRKRALSKTNGLLAIETMLKYIIKWTQRTVPYSTSYGNW